MAIGVVVVGGVDPELPRPNEHIARAGNQCELYHGEAHSVQQQQQREGGHAMADGLRHTKLSHQGTADNVAKPCQC